MSILPVDFDEVTERAAELGVRATAVLVEHDQAGMAGLAALAESGQLRAHVSGAYPLAEAAKALAEGETGRVTGKLVLTVRPWARGKGFARCLAPARKLASVDEVRRILDAATGK